MSQPLQRSLRDYGAGGGQLSLSGAVEDEPEDGTDNGVPGRWEPDTQHPGELAAWEHGPERLSIIAINATDVSDAEEYEILRVRSYPGSRPDESGCLDTVSDRGDARDIAREYMRSAE